jgi:hypothetical protein
MKLLGALLALVLAVSASQINVPRSEWLEGFVPDRTIESFSFKPNREYKFFYNGQLATGIPGSSHQHSATRIQALVSLVFKTETECVLKVREVRFGKLSDEMTRPRDIMPFSMFETVAVEPELYERLMKPIKFEYKHGMISEVVFDGEEQPWSANIKRGILNTIQINLNKEQLVHEVPERLRYDVDVKDNIESFKTIEKTIEGECETLYTVVSNPCRHASLCRSVDKPVVNITKSINFEKCQRRPEIRYNERFEQLCPSCEPRFRREERTFRASTVQRVNAVCEHHDRKNCLIEQATVESQYNLAVLNEEANMITTYVNQTIELVCECEPQLENIELRSPKRSDSDMIYTLDWDIVKEEFFLEGREEFQQQTPFSPLEDKIEFVKSILQKMVMYMREKVDEEAPRQFTRLVKVLRMLKRDELERCHELFFKQTPEGFTHEEHKKIKDVLPDAMALCGTHDCVHHLVHMIKTDAIKPLKASFVIRKLMDIRVVSKNTIQKVMSICESSEKCERHAALKQAVYLSAGSMMRAMCTEQTRDKLAVEFKKPEPFCTEEIKEEFVRLLTSKLFESEKLYDQVLCMKALSNAGIDVSIKLLEKVIRNVDRKYPTVVRVEAMLATRNLIDQIPNKIVKILLPIYMNRDECAQCRNTAVYMVLQCAPEKYIVDQIAHQVKVERHRQVSAFTFTLLESMANSTEPCEKRLADDIKLSLRHARYVPLNSWLFNSKYIRVVEKYHKSINKGYSLDMAAIYSNHSIVPHTWAATLNMIGYGQYTPNFFTIGMRQEGLGKIVNALLRQHTHKLQSSLSDLLSGKFELPSPRFNYRQELKDLFNKLNVDERNVEDDQTPFGSIFMKFRNQEYGFIPLSSEMLPEELIELLGSETTNINELVKRAERLLKDVTLPFNVHTATFMTETSRKIPTTIGLPLTASMKMPTMMQASGVLKIEVDETDPLKKVKIIMTDVKPSIVMTKIAKMESWSPIMNTGVKIVATAKVFTPFEAAVEIDRTVEPTEFKLTVKPLLNAREEIVAVQCRPICFTLVWPKQLRQWQEPEEKTIYGSEWTRVMKHDREFGEYALGMKLRSRGFWHYLPQKHQPNTPIACFAGNNKYSLTAEPGYEMPKEFVIRVTGNVFKTFDNKNVNVNFEKFFEENTENFLSKDSSEENIDETIKSAHYKTYKGERPVNNEIEIELSTKGSSIKRECKVNANCLCDEQVKSCKCKLAVERTPVPMKETKPWKLNSELEILYPKTPYTISELTSEKQLLTKFTCKWGDEKEITIKMIGEQSRRMQELKNRSQYKRLHDNQQHRENFRSLFSPVAQYTPTLKYSLLDEIKIDIDYKLEKVEKQLMSRVYSWVKQQYFWQTNTSDVEIRNPEDRLRVKLNLDPLNRRYLNVTVWSPREQTKIEDIPLPIAVTSLNMRRLSTPSQSWYQMVSNAVSGSRPVCEIRTDSIRTFDEIRYDIPTSTCYSVLAKDCRSAELSKFAVLIKKQTVNSEKKTLKIVTENVKLVVRATEQESLICELNGEEKPCEEVREVREHGEHTVLRCSLTPRSIYMRCELPEAGISVYFDGLSANIKVSPMYRRQVCGLCSQYEEEQFITSKLERVSEKSKLFESFLVKEDSECEHEINEKKSLRTFEIFDDEYNTESLKPIIREEQEIEPIERTDVIEQAQELCFSKQPVKKCPRGSHPIEFQTKEKIVYTCMSKNELQAEIFERRVRIEKEVLRSEIENLPSSFTEARKIPSKCRFY